MTGGGHQGIGLSGVSRSAFGGRLQVPAAAQGWSALPKNIFGSQVSALRSLVRVIRYRYGCGGKIQILNLYPYLNT